MVTKEELEADYQGKAEEARTAASAAAAADEKYKRTQADLDLVRKDLDARRNSRLDDIVKRVSDISSRDTAGAGATGAAAART
jgi:hypothetical protein